MGTFRLAPETFRFTVILGLLAAIPSLSIDISAPTLITVQGQFGASSGLVGLTITLFMLGFALGQFGSGPFSDRFGRKPILLLGLLTYTLAAAGCALSRSVETLVTWRLVQGLAAGACSVLAFAIVRDLFEGDAARRKRSYVAVVFGLAPMLAPTIGAALLSLTGWRSVYLLLSLGGLLLLTVVLLSVSESRDPRLSIPLSFMPAYKRVLSCPSFVSLALVNALSFGGIFAYIAGSAFVFMGSMSLTGQLYGVIFACTAASLTLGAWLSGRAVGAGIGPSILLRIGLLTSAATAIGIVGLLTTGHGPLPAIIPLLLLNMCSRGLIAPNAQHLALDPVAQHAGTAAAAVGMMQITCGAFASALVTGLVPVLGPAAMGIVMAALSSSALALYLVTWRARRNKATSSIVLTPKPLGSEHAEPIQVVAAEAIL